MRYAAIVLVLACYPLFLEFLKGMPSRRKLAFALLGFSLFLGDTLRIYAAPVAWPLWNGLAKGIEFSPSDALALALLTTRRTTPGRLPYWGLFWFYGATLVVSIIPSFSAMASFFMVWQFLRVVLLFAAVGGECHRPDARAGLLAGFALGLLLQAAFVAQEKVSGVVQASGTMFHQNSLGMMIELAIIPLIGAIMAGDKRKLILAGVVGGLVVVAGGGSRGTIGFAGGGAAVLVALSLFRGVTPSKTKVVGLGVLAVVLVGPLAMMTLKDRFGTTSVTTQDDQRPAFERAARAMANDYPVGVGANLYVPTANTQGYAQRAGVGWNLANRSAPVHNAYLLARAETGWTGELALILLILVPLLTGLLYAFRHRRSPDGELALASSVALGVNAIHNNYEFATLTYSVMALVAVTIGLIAAQRRVPRLSASSSAARKVRSGFVPNSGSAFYPAA